MAIHHLVYRINPTCQNTITRDELKASTLRNQIKSPFLRLPAEIRNQIYSYVLKDDVSDKIELCVDVSCVLVRGYAAKRAAAHAHSPRHVLQVLEVCQQTYAETRQLVFKIKPISSGHEALDRYLWGPQRNILTVDQWSSVKVIMLEVSEACLAYGPGYTIIRFGGIIKGTIQRLKRLAGLGHLIVTIRCQGLFSDDDRALPEESTPLIRQHVQDLVKRDGKAIKVEILGVRSMF